MQLPEDAAVATTRLTAEPRPTAVGRAFTVPMLGRKVFITCALEIFDTGHSHVEMGPKERV